MTGRLLRPTGWLGAARETGAEPLLTGREEAYAESTLRKNARGMAREGAVPIAERALERQVEQAVKASPPDTSTFVYTDMFDQVFWSKRPSHAGPIGNRGNRILGATYFGMTFARAGSGPLLAYHVSWHKPAAPLIDALQDLHATETRAEWLGAKVDVHVWDRGGAGAPTLDWAMKRGVPFLTVMRGSVNWKKFRHPQTHTSLGVPVFVRADPKLSGRSSVQRAPILREIIFPAHPEKGLHCSKALRYKTTAILDEEQLMKLDQVYKTRWPNNENGIKDLVAVGFNRNLDRTLVLSTSRGTDGKRIRLADKRAQLDAEILLLEKTAMSSRVRDKIARRRKRLRRIVKEETVLAAPPDKGTRAPSGAELLVKVFTMIVFNALRLMLAKSAHEAVRSMSIASVRGLLLSRSVLTVMDGVALRLFVAPIRDVRERELQQQLLDVANAAQLSIDDRPLVFALQPCAPPRKLRVRRISRK